MAKKKKTATKKTAPTKSAKKAVKKAIKKPTAAKKPPAAKPTPPPVDDALSLGRPIVTQEEKLYMLFKEDYHARQIFEFLRVETVKELEEFSPQEILKRLSEPIRQTIDRIRKKLADKKRSLAGDEEFALKHRPT